MKVARVIAPRTVEIADLPRPEPRPGWVLVRVHSVGICGTDLAIYRGDLAYIRSGLMKYPVVAGHEWAGEVVEVGSGVDHVRPGQRVTGETHVGCMECERCMQGKYVMCSSLLRVGIGGLAGGFAEYVSVPQRSVHVIPDSMSYTSASLIEPITVVLQALERVRLAGGEKVVVIGPGPLGLIGVRLSKALGASRVSLIGTKDNRLEIGRSLGADWTINASSDPEAPKSLMGSADVVLEASGDPKAFEPGLSYLRKGGRLALVSLYEERVHDIDLAKVVIGNITIAGSLGSPGIWERALGLAPLLTGIERIITHKFSIDNAGSVLDMAAGKRGGVIKALLLHDVAKSDESA